MSARIDPATVQMRDLICDGCGVPMRWDGEVLLTDPPQYRHVCPRCWREDMRGISYPALVAATRPKP